MAQPKVVEAEPEASAKRVSHFRAQNLTIRWHEDIVERLDVVPTLVKWAESKGHLVQVTDTVRGQSVRIGGSLRPGAGLMTKATRDLIREAGFTPEQLAEIIERAAKNRG
jgi:hypothetical protein